MKQPYHTNQPSARMLRGTQNQTPLRRSHRFASAMMLAGITAISSPHAETFTLEEATMDQIQAAMAAGALSSAELTTMYLNRIAIYDRSGLQLNSVVEINPAALTEAAAADDLRAAGEVRGPFHGVPTLPKMNHAVSGLPLNLDIPELEGAVATADAENVVRLRAGGSVILGLVNMDSYYIDDLYSDNETVYGPARHAYREDYYPGDSSTGSGTAIASNFASMSVGGDTGTSNRCNSGVSALVTGRTTFGLLSGRGVAPLAATRDQAAPMTRTVRDMAYAYDALIGDDPLDATRAWRFADHRFPTQSYATALRTDALVGSRLGYTQEVIDTSSPETRALFLAAIADLRAAGATVVEITPFPDFREHIGFFAEAFNADFTADYGTGFEEINSQYASCRWAFTEFAAFTSPAIAIDIPFAIWWGDEAAADYAPFANLAPGVGPVSATYVAHRAAERALFEGWYAANTVDAVIYPVDGFGAIPRTAEDPFPEEFFLPLEYAWAVPGTGLPCVVAFGGFSEPETPDLGIEFTGPAFSDAKLLGYAYAYEQATKHRKAPSLTPPLPGETIEYSTALPPPSRPELNAPALRVAGGAKVTGKGKEAALVINGGARDASGLSSLKVYVNGKKIAAKRAANWKASVKLSALRKFVRGDAKTVTVQVVAKDIYGNTSVTTKNVKLPKGA